jgi:hypothetical protein
MVYHDDRNICIPSPFRTSIAGSSSVKEDPNVLDSCLARFESLAKLLKEELVLLLFFMLEDDFGELTEEFSESLANSVRPCSVDVAGDVTDTSVLGGIVI